MVVQKCSGTQFYELAISFAENISGQGNRSVKEKLLLRYKI